MLHSKPGMYLKTSSIMRKQLALLSSPKSHFTVKMRYWTVWRLNHLKPPIQEELSKVAELEPLWYKQGDTSRDYRATLKDGSTTTCGFILPTSTPFCEGCRRLRLDSAGRLYGCLAQPDTFPLHESLKMAGCGDLNPLRKQIVEALNIKKRPQAFRQQAAMIDIGG